MGMPIHHVVLPSAARTVATVTPPLPGAGQDTLKVIVSVTAVTGAPSLTVTLQGLNPISGLWHTVLTSAAISTVTENVLQVGPELIDAANLKANACVPFTWRVSVAVGTADSVTYSIYAELNS